MISATGNAKAATGGDWGRVWTSFDPRKKGKPTIDDGQGSQAEAGSEGSDMFAGVE